MKAEGILPCRCDIGQDPPKTTGEWYYVPGFYREPSAHYIAGSNGEWKTLCGQFWGESFPYFESNWWEEVAKDIYSDLRPVMKRMVKAEETQRHCKVCEKMLHKTWRPRFESRRDDKHAVA